MIGGFHPTGPLTPAIMISREDDRGGHHKTIFNNDLHFRINPLRLVSNSEMMTDLLAFFVQRDIRH